jgi:hypothetical protein
VWLAVVIGGNFGPFQDSRNFLGSGIHVGRGSKAVKGNQTERAQKGMGMNVGIQDSLTLHGRNTIVGRMNARNGQVVGRVLWWWWWWWCTRTAALAAGDRGLQATNSTIGFMTQGQS